MTRWLMHVYFLGLFWWGTGLRYGSGVGKGVLLSAAAAALLGVLPWVQSKMEGEEVRLSGRMRLWIWVTGVFFIFMFLQSVVDMGGSELRYFVSGSIPWACTVALPVLGTSRHWEEFRRALRVHLPLGVLINAVVIAMSWDEATGTLLKRIEITSLVKHQQMLLYPVHFFLFQYAALSARERVWTIAGMAEYLFLAIVSETRGGILTNGAAVLMAFVCYLKTVDKSILSARRARFISSAALVLILFVAAHLLIPQISHRFLSLRDRFTTEQENASIVKNPRWKEIGVFFRQCGPLDILAGRGIIGGFNNYVIPGNNKSLHIAYFHMILKGGIFLAIFMIIFPLITSINIFKNYNGIELAASATIIMMIIKFFSGNPIFSGIHPLYFISLVSIGFCLNLKNANNEYKLNT
jgi:hypothetical protein